MSLIGVLFILMFVVSLGAFIFLTVKTCKSLGAVATTMLYFSFFSTWAFLLLGAGVHDQRVFWTMRHHKAKAEYEKLEAEKLKLRFGDLTSTAVEDEDNAITPLFGKLNRLTMDRGRAWRGIQFSSFAPSPELLTLKFDPKQIANGDPGELKAKENVEGLVVYVFAERMDPTGKYSLPYAYLGEFAVSEVSGQDLKLKPTLPLLASQHAMLANSEAEMMTIFELMPLDSHEAFATDESKSTDSELFGHMDPVQIAALLNINVDLATQDTRGNIDDPLVRDALRLRSYLIDGQEAPADAPPESLWTELEFTSDYAIDVDSKEQRNATDGGYFDPSGKTVDARLKREAAEVRFNAGQKGVFGRESAEEIIKLGVARATKRIYVRPLNNYEFAFREARQSLLQVEQQRSLLARERKVLEQTTLEGQEVIRLRSDERQKLDRDLAQVTKEQEVAGNEVSRLESQLVSLKAGISESYQKLKALHAQIKAQSGVMVGVGK